MFGPTALAIQCLLSITGQPASVDNQLPAVERQPRLAKHSPSQNTWVCLEAGGPSGHQEVSAPCAHRAHTVQACFLDQNLDQTWS